MDGLGRRGEDSAEPIEEEPVSVRLSSMVCNKTGDLLGPSLDERVRETDKVG